MANMVVAEPTLAEAKQVRAYMDTGLTCTEIDSMLGNDAGRARDVLTWWWRLSEAEGGMPDIDAE